MRKLNETRNFSSLLGLIEEAQVMFNRMEAHLRGVARIRTLEEDIQKLKKERRALQKELGKEEYDH
jgi:hypothetical protein